MISAVRWLSIFCNVCLLTIKSIASSNSVWDQWWTYGEGTSGPQYWGLIMPDEWGMCAKGRYQSPVNIDPKRLLFDPNLKPLIVDKGGADGILENIGQMLVYRVFENVTGLSARGKINISGGPLGMYKYRWAQLHIRFGEFNSFGSEHSIDNRSFPGEIQVLGYNFDLFQSFEEALKQPKGLVIISIMFYVSKSNSALNTELRRLAVEIPKVLYRGRRVPLLQPISLFWLLPRTDQYVTYEGSLTYPGCYESVTWILMNKPIYINMQDLRKLRDIQSTELKQEIPLTMSNNFRPRQPLNGRTLRTNIDFKYQKSIPGMQCTSPRNEIFYKTNPKFPYHSTTSPDH